MGFGSELNIKGPEVAIWNTKYMKGKYLMVNLSASKNSKWE